MLRTLWSSELWQFGVRWSAQESCPEVRQAGFLVPWGWRYRMYDYDYCVRTGGGGIA